MEPGIREPLPVVWTTVDRARLPGRLWPNVSDRPSRTRFHVSTSHSAQTVAVSLGAERTQRGPRRWRVLADDRRRSQGAPRSSRRTGRRQNRLCRSHNPPWSTTWRPAAAPPAPAQATDGRAFIAGRDETEQSRAGRGRPVPRLLPFVHSTSPAPAARRTRVAGGAEEQLLARCIREQTPTSRRMCSHAVDGRARDPGGSPFACESRCARPRERRAAGARPLREHRESASGCSERLGLRQSDRVAVVCPCIAQDRQPRRDCTTRRRAVVSVGRTQVMGAVQAVAGFSGGIPALLPATPAI
jgi:hypothetical protein